MGILQHQLSVWKARQHSGASAASLPFVPDLTCAACYLIPLLKSPSGDSHFLIGSLSINVSSSAGLYPWFTHRKCAAELAMMSFSDGTGAGMRDNRLARSPGASVIKSRRSVFVAQPPCPSRLFPIQRFLSESPRLGSPQDSSILPSWFFGGPPLDLRDLHCRTVNL